MGPKPSLIQPSHHGMGDMAKHVGYPQNLRSKFYYVTNRSNCIEKENSSSKLYKVKPRIGNQPYLMG